MGNTCLLVEYVMNIDYSLISKWSMVVFLAASVLNIAADWVRYTRNLGALYYVGTFGAVVAIWASYMRLMNALQEVETAKAEAAAAEAEKPEFPTVEIDDPKKPSKMD